jgi:hypothetical protein
MLLADFVVDLVEGLKVFGLRVVLYQVALPIVFVKSGQEGTELEPFVAIGDELQQDVSCISFEDVQGKEYREKVTNLFLETRPHLTLRVR